MYHQVSAPLWGSLGWSALIAALPLLVLFVLLGVFRIRAWLASLVGLALSLVVAVAAYRMPAGAAFDSALEGAAFGLFPALWIVVNAIWIYQLTRRSGHFDVLRRSFARISDDQRVQGIIIAFSFGALLEALAGFGAPVAICSVMLVAVGLKPIKAATIALIANTAPVAYGAVALPVITLAKVTGLPLPDLAAMTGRQVPVLALIVPLVLVVVLDGRRGLRQAWPAALVCGASFAVAQYLMANFGVVQLTDIVASLVSATAVLLLLRVWKPRPAEPVPAADVAPPPSGGGGATTAVRTAAAATDTRIEVVRAFAPYVAVIVLFSLAAVPPVAAALAHTTSTFGWPGLHVANASGKAVTLVQFKFDWLADSGTVLFVAGLLTIPLLKLRARDALRAYGHTIVQLRTAALTVTAVLALAYVMNMSGQTATLGLFLAGAGGLFALLSPLLGWFGTAVTGSDTSSNSLFGALQVGAAGGAGISPLLMAAANTSGGVLGKMISPQNLAIGASAVGLAGREGLLFRRVLAASAVFVPLMCVLVYLQSTPILSWMVPS
ncbi:L-lactate permease [Amycolatopsis acidiphila]|uniref:L-lactate permease n=1 Tax=Amycolatopsis acidiphila TaxID=715473 RepID=A0A558AFF2_9PSEU|nr:L-lactate permease [Amycolatopsis acidiphila]TVT22990.1 L-lactate permease [Amycolatopsis acidiphila]UIJ57153.1 L-lactate permease [Amycolatopsis acidiphila]GHG53030.1 L-lactate permease [Amycolatopsis acidiphila]